MRTTIHLVAAAFAMLLAGPANAWWSYAEWGLSQSQILSASSGRAVPCREGIPVCARTSDGGQPSLFVESVEMVRMPASVSFVFDAEGKLSRTIVLFPNADFGLISNLLTGIHGEAVGERPGPPPVKIWRDKKRGSTISATPAEAGSRLLYQPGSPG